MTKRFTIKPQDDLFGVVDNYSPDKVCVINGIRTAIEAKWLCKDMNALNNENEQLKQSYTKLEHRHSLLHDECLDAECDRDSYQKDVLSLEEENEQLKKELHLMHIRTMFSTVQSFKGDVSERYTYSDETDTIYDTANHYGQYNKVLDKKEIVMLLNEYETILKELKE